MASASTHGPQVRSAPSIATASVSPEKYDTAVHWNDSLQTTRKGVRCWNEIASVTSPVLTRKYAAVAAASGANENQSEPPTSPSVAKYDHAAAAAASTTEPRLKAVRSGESFRPGRKMTPVSPTSPTTIASSGPSVATARMTNGWVAVSSVLNRGNRTGRAPASAARAATSR